MTAIELWINIFYHSVFGAVTSSGAGGRKSVLKSSESFDTMEGNCSEVPGTILFRDQEVVWKTWKSD